MPVGEQHQARQGGFLDGARRIVTWKERDAYRPATILALVGLTVAAAMALFGLPGVDLHPITHRWGIMDPLCGGTRAARYTMLGELGLAWRRYNPLGIAVVIGAALALARAGYGVAINRWLTLHWSASSRAKRVVVALVVSGVVALEVRQQGRSDLLMS